jgi:RNA polymerase sigma factor (sigma-70 family)
MVAALTRVFGVHNLALVEDVVQEAFCRAMEVWPYCGAPDNPQAWLMSTAKNRALDVLRRERTTRAFAPELERYLKSEWSLAPAIEELLGPDAIKDDQLRMIFSCCQPRLSPESQIALILHILCGFGVDEVAAALVGGHSAAEKRISRGKQALASSKRLFDVTTPADFTARLPTVQRALYLLFNEGYHGASTQVVVRAELCREAMRLCAVLLQHPLGATPASYALSALMCLNAARLQGRLDASGELHNLADQVRSQWDQQLIVEGLELLGRSATGQTLSEYHVEAAIAAFHSTASISGETDWAAIASLYDVLLSLHPTPVVALNRAIAIAQIEGPARGVEEIDAIADRKRLAAYPFYYAALGELEFTRERYAEARGFFEKATSFARNQTERNYLERRVRACADSDSTGVRSFAPKQVASSREPSDQVVHATSCGSGDRES